ncbi:MAG: hypothetical protein LBV15_03360, partial [Planctomycetota bacterium]|nr:hypothetical protein [Planctomycetota bacterium]
MLPFAFPFWSHCLLLAFLAAVNFLSASYGSALLGASRFRIKQALENRDLPASGFLAKAAEDDPSILMRVDLLYVSSTAVFICLGVWQIIRDDGSLSPSHYIRGAAVFILALFLLRMAANPLGGRFSEKLVVGAALPMVVLTAPFLPLARLALAAG